MQNFRVLPVWTQDASSSRAGVPNPWTSTGLWPVRNRLDQSLSIMSHLIIINSDAVQGPIINNKGTLITWKIPRVQKPPPRNPGQRPNSYYRTAAICDSPLNLLLRLVLCFEHNRHSHLLKEWANMGLRKITLRRTEMDYRDQLRLL